MQYTRNEADFSRGTFRVRGDTIDIFPAEHAELAIRIELFDDEIESLQLFDPLTGRIRQKIPRFTVYPSQPLRDAARHAWCARSKRSRTNCASGSSSSTATASWSRRSGSSSAPASTSRCCRRSGHCKGIENYTRHLSGAAPGEPPPTLVDYLPTDALMFLDESHVLIGQLGGMYNGDRARKTTLVDYGFRLPSALDNRPLKFDEFERKMRQVVFVSATPADYEKKTRRPGGRAAGASDRPGRSGGRGAAGDAPRSTTCCRRSTSASKWTSAC